MGRGYLPRSHTKKPKKLKTLPTKQKEITLPKNQIDSRVLLLAIQNYIYNHKSVPDPADKEYIEDVCKESHINCDYSHKLERGEIRLFWLYLMNHHNLICDLCGHPIVLQKDLTYDHIVPKSKGGKTDAENASPTHKRCNNLKGNIMPDEWEQVGDAILMSRGIQINYNLAGYNYRGRQNGR